MNLLGLTLAATVFAVVGLYYVTHARYLCGLSERSILKMPRIFQFLFPVGWYRSEAWVWSLRAGRMVALLISLVLFGLLVVSLVKALPEAI